MNDSAAQSASIRTLVVFHLGVVGGPGHSLLPAMTWLASRGPIEFAVPEEGPVADRYSALGRVTVARYETLTYVRGLRERLLAARRLARDVRAFRTMIRQRRPDLVVVVTTTVPSALVAAWLEGISTVVYAAEVYDQDWKRAPLLRIWGAVLARLTAGFASALVSCSETVAAQFPARGRKPLAVAYPPIGTRYSDGDRERGRTQYGVPGADPCIAVVGALTRGRGQDLALRALALVRRRVPTARLLLVGAPHARAADTAFAEELKALARELDVADAVVFAGTTDAVADVYAAADVVLNPARFAEPFGRVAPEALVAGTPVVATRTGALEEVIRDDVDGLLVKPDDPEALAAAAIRILEDGELGERLATSGREWVLARFGADQNLATWQRVVGSVLTGVSTRRGR